MRCFAALSMTLRSGVLALVMLNAAERSRSILYLPTPSVRSGRCVTSVYNPQTILAIVSKEHLTDLIRESSFAQYLARMPIRAPDYRAGTSTTFRPLDSVLVLVNETINPRTTTMLMIFFPRIIARRVLVQIESWIATYNPFFPTTSVRLLVRNPFQNAQRSLAMPRLNLNPFELATD